MCQEISCSKVSKLFEVYLFEYSHTSILKIHIAMCMFILKYYYFALALCHVCLETEKMRNEMCKENIVNKEKSRII